MLLRDAEPGENAEFQAGDAFLHFLFSATTTHFDKFILQCMIDIIVKNNFPIQKKKL